MALQIFDIEKIGELDPVVSAQINKMIIEASNDCHNRPSDKSPRKVTIDMNFRPEPETDGDQIAMDFDLAIKTPKRHSRLFNFSRKANGKLVFNSSNPGDIRQMSLDEKDGRKEPDE